MVPDNEYYTPFKESIEKVWLKKLLYEFSLCNHQIASVLGKQLSLPSFRFALVKERLGSWSKADNTIMLSYYLLRNYSWDNVVQVLRHEMAHMICSEIWGDVEDNGRIHGELFAKACNIVGVPESTKLIPEYDIEKKEKIVSRIHKLFALGESNHEAEAKSAVGKAYELMTQYNISLGEAPADSRKFVFRPVGDIYGRIPTHINMLANLISRHYFVRSIFVTYEYHWSDVRRGVRRFVEVFGEPHNVDVAEYVFHFLLCEGERQWRDFASSSGFRKGEHRKNAFLEGFFSGFDRKLRDEKEKMAQEIPAGNTLPIGLDDPLLTENFNKRYNPVTRYTHSAGSNSAGRYIGSQRGAAVKIRQAVTRNGGETKLIG